MTTKAWVTLSITWSIITFYAVYFFIKVLRNPPPDDDAP